MSSGFDGWRYDLRLAVRGLRRAPAFTASAVAILGFGIGAATILFSLVHAVVLRPLPLADPDRVVWLAASDAGREATLSPSVLHAWRRDTEALAHMAAIRPTTLTVTDAGSHPERLDALVASSDLFPVLGVTLHAGRAFGPGDDRPESARVVVLSHRFFQGRFGRDPSTLGRTIRIDGEPHAIIGVLPPSLDTIFDYDLWLPMRLGGAHAATVTARYLMGVGRLHPDASPGQAATELRDQLGRHHPPSRAASPLDARVVALGPRLADRAGRGLVALLGAVGCLLVIACGNVASLLLSRGTQRGPELALRAALGAGRGRLVRQLLTESLVLAAAAGVVGVMLAVLGVPLVTRILPFDVPRLGQTDINLTVLLFAGAVALTSSVLFGLVPAVHGTRIDLDRTLRAGHRSVVGRQRLRWLFVASQVALSVVLLVAGGLLARGALTAARQPLGFATDGVLTAQLALPLAQTGGTEAAVVTYRTIVEHVRHVPGVTRAAIISRVPLAGGDTGIAFHLEGGHRPPDDPMPARVRIAGADAIDVLGISLLAGRDVRADDRADAARALVVNRAFATRVGLTPDAIVGRYVTSENGAFVDETGAALRWQVVGVVDNVREGGLTRAYEPTAYLPLAQAPDGLWEWLGGQMLLTVATGTPGPSVASLQAAVAGVDPRVPLFDVRTLDQRLVAARAVERFSLWLVAAFAALGLGLAAVGIHAVVAGFVHQRVPEIGLRIALGADRRAVERLVARQGLLPIVVGLVIGGLGGIAAGALLERQLSGVPAADPVTFAAAALVLLATATIASALPAARAARVDPATALRQS